MLSNASQYANAYSPISVRELGRSTSFSLVQYSNVRVGIGYVHTPAERAALLTIPKVLKRGKIISGHDNHKENGFATVTITAPVIINGKRGGVGVVVQKTGKNKYHAHRILLLDGSVFVLNKTDAELSTASMLSVETQQRLPNSSASNNSIPHSTEKSTETAKKVSIDGKVVQMSLKDGANQQTSGDIDDLIRSAGIEGDAAEIREDLAELYRMNSKATSKGRIFTNANRKSRSPLPLF